MSVHVITGVSRGIGFEFLEQLSEDTENLVIGLVRDKTTTEKKVVAELDDLFNVYILHADLTKYVSLKQAAADTSEIVGERGIDYLVADGGIVSYLDGFGPSVHCKKDKVEGLEVVSAELSQTNVVSNIHLFNLFLPMVTKGKAKKVISIFIGLADLDLTNNAAMDIKDVVLFMSINPGVVEVSHYANSTPEEMQGLMGFLGKLTTYAPQFKGSISTEESVRCIGSVCQKASIENAGGGSFVSHLKTKQWV
ncbi:putative short chain dehydrogenase [Xylaria curta]|nr:putative short chain dehydrogenase [Xylaria curta]